MTTETTLTIDDLSARSAETLNIADALVRLRGVAQVHVNSSIETARVQYDPSLIGPVELLDTVRAVGFQARELVHR